MTEETKPFNEELRARLRAYKDETGTSDADLGKQIGSNATSINRYLNGKPIGDVDALERAIEDFFDRIGIQAAASRATEGLIRNRVIDLTCSSLTRIQRTQDFSTLTGPAGCGKTAAIGKYLGEHPTALGIRVTRATRTDYGVLWMLLDQLPSRGLNDSRSTWDFILRKLRGSKRLVIVDGAHKLSQSGFETLFDLHDEAGIPIALVGNACMEAAIKGVQEKQREKNEQHTSRVGLRIQIKPNYTPNQVEEFTKLFWAEPSAALLKHALRIANGPGHLRLLKKHLQLLPDFIGETKGNDVEALELAHTQLLTEVELVSNQ